MNAASNENLLPEGACYTRATLPNMKTEGLGRRPHKKNRSLPQGLTSYVAQCGKLFHILVSR